MAGFVPALVSAFLLKSVFLPFAKALGGTSSREEIGLKASFFMGCAF